MKVTFINQINTTLRNGITIPSGSIMVSGKLRKHVSILDIPEFDYIDRMEVLISILGRITTCYKCLQVGHTAKSCFKLFCRFCHDLKVSGHACKGLPIPKYILNTEQCKLSLDQEANVTASFIPEKHPLAEVSSTTQQYPFPPPLSNYPEKLSFLREIKSENVQHNSHFKSQSFSEKFAHLAPLPSGTSLVSSGIFFHETQKTSPEFLSSANSSLEDVSFDQFNDNLQQYDQLNKSLSTSPIQSPSPLLVSNSFFHDSIQNPRQSSLDFTPAPTLDFADFCLTQVQTTKEEQRALKHKARNRKKTVVKKCASDLALK